MIYSLQMLAFKSQIFVYLVQDSGEAANMPRMSTTGCMYLHGAWQWGQTDTGKGSKVISVCCDVGMEDCYEICAMDDDIEH